MSTPQSPSQERYVGIAGIAFLVLSLVASFLDGSTNAADPAAKVATSITSHRAATIAEAYLILAAAAAFLLFAAGVSNILSRGNGTLPILSAAVFGAGLISIALLGVAHGVLGALAGYIARDSNPDTVRGMYAVYDGVVTASDLFLGIFVLMSSILAFGARVLPPWMRWIGIFAGTCLVVGSASLATPERGVGLLIVVGFFATLLWVASTSVWILLGRTSPRP